MDTILAFDSVRSLLLLAIALLIGYPILSWIFQKTSKKLPPGPREWGTTWKLVKASWNGTLPVLATEWAEMYGDLTFVNCPGQPMLFLNTASVTRLMLSSDKYKLLVADRSQIVTSRIANFNGKDLLFSKFDAIMRKKRRLFHKVLGIYGDGVDRFENVVWGQMERMFVEIEMFEGQDAEFTNILVRSLKSILYILTTGQPPADPAIPDILEEYDLALNKLSRPDVDVVLKYLPFMAYLPGSFKKAVDHVRTAKVKADEIVFHGQQRTHVPGQPRGITDILLDYKKKPGYEWMDKDEEHIISFLTTLFMAAQLTSRAALVGTFLCLLNYPDVAKKIQEEVDRVIADERPRIEYKSSMPYTEAAILEGLRLISQAPLSGFRLASQDFDFEGMFIPKNTLILMNNWFYLHDENIWEDPWVFKPERFLDSEGKILPIDHQKRRDLIAFGVGVRACPGEIFARSRVFLFVTSILQRYDLLPAANEKLPPADFQVHDEEVQGLLRQTPGYRCRLIRREKFQK